jgi:4-hydroxybenzoyl-CoA reductase subunit beta
MHLPRFTYYRLSSRAEAARLLKEYGARARLVAGGTDLFPRMKYGLVKPELLVSLKDAVVKNPELDERGNLHIDPLMTLAEMARSSIIREKYSLLADAALNVGSNQIRNMATLGGNICLENRCLYYNQSHSFQFVIPCFKRGGDRCYLYPRGNKCFAVFVADTVTPLISLGAQITFTDGETIRTLPLQELYTGDAARPLDRKEGEILAEVVVPVQKGIFGAVFMKFCLRGGLEFSALNVATVIQLDEGGHTCLEARLTAGAIAQAPARLEEAEAALKDQPPSAGLFKEVGRIAASEAAPLPHHGYSATYLKASLDIHVRRALERAFTIASEHRNRRL